MSNLTDEEMVARMREGMDEEIVKPPRIGLTCRRSKALILSVKLEEAFANMPGVNRALVTEGAVKLSPLCNMSASEIVMAWEPLLPVTNNALGRMQLALAVLEKKQPVSIINPPGVTTPVWVHSMILESTTAQSKSKKIRAKLICLLMTGANAGKIEVFVIKRSKTYQMMRDIGITNIRRQADPPELTGAWATLLLGSTREEGYTIIKACATGDAHKHNVELWNSRRMKHCKERWYECSACEMGRDKCPQACRMKTTVKVKENG